MLMPCPQSLQVSGGDYWLKPQITIFIQGMSNPRRIAAIQTIRSQLGRLENFNFTVFERVKQKHQADIIISVSNTKSGEAQSGSEYYLPKLGDDEAYQLTIQASNINIQAISEFGVIHGLTTLMQLITQADKRTDPNKKLPSSLKLPQLKINDSPRFKWRGLLIDSVRHFIPIKDIKRQLDGMAAAKLNVFHWHLTDDQGWRIALDSYPKLHLQASDGLYYTQEQIKDVVNYASLLGIRVLPEFDIPGHASAIAVAYPELIAEKREYQMERHWGVFDPVLDVSQSRVYEFVETVIAELASLFPDEYLHIGGDEVKPDQWMENPKITQFMNEKALTTSSDLQHYFNQKIQLILTKYGRKMMGWDEIYHPSLSKQVVIQSWRGIDSLNLFANRGYQGILSTGYYIDQPQYSSYHYRNDPAYNVNDDTFTLVEGEHYRLWKLTIPRLKGNPVKGHLVIKTNHQGTQAETTSGYLQLNGNSFRKVNLLTFNQQTDDTPNDHLTLVFTADSWMGPLRFEIEPAINNATDNQDSNQPLSYANQRVFIGNTYYPLRADEVIAPASLTVALSKPLSQHTSANVLGGEATLWSEMVTPENIDLRIWPRLFVIAERLWSSAIINDVPNMYKRLDTIEKYARQVIDLQHKQQRLMGFGKFLGVNYSDETMTALSIISALFEPAHYYTRHHIKYQQEQYHQQARLDNLVDFLPVESSVLIKLSQTINAYESDDASALLDIESSLKAWQRHAIQLQHSGFDRAKYADFLSLLHNTERLTAMGLDIVNGCSDKDLYTQQEWYELAYQLKILQQRQDEIVLAAIPQFLKLLTICTDQPGR
jgi:hexosaminidase